MARIVLGYILITVIFCVDQVYGQGLDYVNLIHTPARKLHQAQLLENDLKYNEIQSALSSISSMDFITIAEKYLFKSKNGLLGIEVGAIGPNFTVSEKCTNDTGRFLFSLVERERWALTMLDAFGKPKPGLLEFAFNWIGDYYECTNVTAPVLASEENIPGVEEFKGQYCSANLPFQAASATPASPMPSFGLNLGVCLPNSCTSDEMVYFINAALDELNITQIPFRVNPMLSNCQNENLEYDTKAVVAIIFGAIFATLLAVGTLYDLLMVQLPKYMIDADDKDGVLNENMENGAPSMNIKHLRSDEHAPLLGEHKKTIKYEAPEPSVCGKILLSFSAYSNGLKILSTKQPKGSLNCVHGIRFISMTWVILGHTLVFGLSAFDNFVSYATPFVKGFAAQAIVNATVSVDTFFTLSGLLVAYLTLKELKKNDGKLNWAMFYFHRYWRLTPPYMFLMLIYVPLFPYITTGPLWPQQGVEIDQCRDSWWTNLLYVNNLVRKNKQCMGWTWYLANDMQFYVLSPLLILPLYYNKYIGMAVNSVFLLATTITAGVISSTYNLQAGLAQTAPIGGSSGNETSNSTNPENSASLDYFMEYYITPYCRMGPYIIGVLAGYYLYKTQMTFRWNKLFVIAGWCVATASALAVVYGLYDVSQGHPISVELSAFYNAVNRTVWGVCICWVVIACVGGYGGPVNIILSWRALIPLSRLTYCAYLIHPVVMYAWFLGQKKTLYMTDSMYVILFFGLLMASFMLAFLLSLLFESPMMGLENVIFKRKKR